MSNQHAQHTAGPWIARQYDDRGNLATVCFCGGWIVGTDSNVEGGYYDNHVGEEQDAKFIALACNSYADLLAALEKAQEALFNEGYHHGISGVMIFIDAAIAKATGE